MNEETDHTNPTTPQQVPIIINDSNRRVGCLNRCLLMVVGAFLILLLFLSPSIIALATGAATFNSIADGIRDFLNPQTTAQVNTTQTLVSRIQPIGDLVSVRVELAKANINVGIRQGPGGICSFEARHVGEATIEASIDLSEITQANFEEDETGKITRIILPEARLFRCTIDYFDQYTYSNPPCRLDLEGAEALARYIAMNEFREDAIMGGIRRRAEHEAIFLIGNLVEFLTGQPIDITFAENGSSTSDDHSCFPEVPPGWIYDETARTWVKS